MKEYRTAVTPVVLSLIQEYQSPVDPDNLTEILKKDAGKMQCPHVLPVFRILLHMYALSILCLY